MSSPRRITRRRALVEAVGGAAALGLLVAGCGSSAVPASVADGSTLRTTWHDPVGDGQLRVGGGEPVVHRTELGPKAATTGTLATFAHVTDAHVLDPSSPARVPFLDRLGPPFQSTFRPQEALTAQVLAGIARSVRALGPELVIQGGDLIDNDQRNELDRALTILRGGTVDPGSGARGYYGVQLGSDTDPFYYRPAVDAPRHPRLLAEAVSPLRSVGVGAPVASVFGDHDGLVAGTVVPTALTRSLAVGDRALWDLPTRLTLPPGLSSGGGSSPDGPPDPGVVDGLLRQVLQIGATVRVPPDARRRQMGFGEVVRVLRAAGPRPDASRRADRLDYALDLGRSLRVIVLDLTRRGGGSGGEVVPGQAAWLNAQLAQTGERWVIVVSHQPIATSTGGGALLAVLDRCPRVIATLNGHTHRNAISARRTSAGGYWTLATASLIDYPQQARAVAIEATGGGGVAIRTWMLDHVDTGPLGTIARELSYLDAQGGRPEGFSAAAADRNAVLYVPPRR